MPHRGGRRFAVTSYVIVFGGLMITGVIMLFTREPDRAATRAANNGATMARSADAEPIQTLHEALSDVMFIVALVAAGWLMVKVKQDWSGRLGAAAAVTLIAVLSGWLVRFDAVNLAGVFREDVRGYGFLFDGELEQVVLAKRRLGPGAFRFWVGLHFASSIAAVALGWFGYRDSLKPPEADRWDDGWLERVHDRQAASEAE